MNPMFEDALCRDLDTVFLADHCEFTERIILDGLTIQAVRESTSSYSARSATSGSTSAGFGSGTMEPELAICDTVLHVRTADLPTGIESGGVVSVDDLQFFVVTRQDSQGGVTRLELARMGY